MTPNLQTADLCVIGGGPAGLAAAIAARRRGLDVTVVDHAMPPVDKVCGEGLMPDGLAAAGALGIHLLDAGGVPFRGIRFYDSDTTVSAEFPRGPGVGLRRVALHRLMLERAAQVGVRLLWGVRVVGLNPREVMTNHGPISARWIAGADGVNSNVRRWAGLDASTRPTVRYGFRRHYRVAFWTDSVEVHWADGCQLYVTPTGASEVCVALLSRNPHLRLDEALFQFPQVRHRLQGADPASAEHGAVTISRRFRRVSSGNVALVGDASGSVDAITGEGVCLAFQQATALADALAAGDLSIYQKAHRRIGRRPRMMASLMLTLDRRSTLRHRVIGALAAYPPLFRRLLALHIGELSPLAAARPVLPVAITH